MVGELLSFARTLVQLLWDACQLCVASIVATLLALLRLSETLRLARLSAALTESSKPPARPVCAAPLALRCSRSSSALHKLLLPPRLSAPHRLTVRGSGCSGPGQLARNPSCGGYKPLHQGNSIILTVTKCCRRSLPYLRPQVE